MTKRDKIILLNILDTIEEMQGYCDKENCTNKKQFISQNMLKRAISMCMISISEVIAHVSDNFKNENAHVNINQFKSIRNIAAHNYGAINFSKLWDALQIDIPILQKQIEMILKNDGYTCINKKRTILIFPEFDNIAEINEIRAKYDPLFDKVRPHITLVFPFESQMPTEDIQNYLENALNKTIPFCTELQGISREKQYLMLNVTAGSNNIIEMHGSLYREFYKYKPTWLKDYRPHLTLGHFNTEEDAETAYEDIKGFDTLFHTIVSKISVEIIGDNEESIIETEYIM